jgi:hypothetical protein
MLLEPRPSEVLVGILHRGAVRSDRLRDDDAFIILDEKREIL